MKLLLDSLKPDDTVSIVTYAGGAGTVLAPTKIADKGKIVAALESLHAGGSTAGAEGVRQAYRLAEQNFDKDGVNRVILATDGDFNVGITNPDELKSFIERKRKTGVFLSVLGFGMGNYNDQLMQTLAQNGDGAAAYIDTLSEARKVLVEEAGSTLFPIAKDVKIQMEFNPQTVSEYRLIGYETRLLNREDFNNDKIDAGEIGAGHSVTAIYELTLKNSPARLVDSLRYQSETTIADDPKSSEYGFLKIRYKLPDEDTSKLITEAIAPGTHEAGDRSPREARFAAAVAETASATGPNSSTSFGWPSRRRRWSSSGAGEIRDADLGLQFRLAECVQEAGLLRHIEAGAGEFIVLAGLQIDMSLHRIGLAGLAGAA
jgi:Ca-activated chloride channel family protein